MRTILLRLSQHSTNVAVVGDGEVKLLPSFGPIPGSPIVRHLLRRFSPHTQLTSYAVRVNNYA
jgi:hypothetical protein